MILLLYWDNIENILRLSKPNLIQLLFFYCSLEVKRVIKTNVLQMRLFYVDISVYISHIYFTSVCFSWIRSWHFCVWPIGGAVVWWSPELMTNVALFSYWTLRVCFLTAKKFKKVEGKVFDSDTLMTSTTLEKEKFPQHYFPDVSLRCLHSRNLILHTKQISQMITWVSFIFYVFPDNIMRCKREDK